MQDIGSNTQQPWLPKLDVIGIGALNLDYVVAREDVPKSLREKFYPGLHDDEEELAENEKVNECIKEFGLARLRFPNGTMGGSTFNAVRAIAETGMGLKIGYIGMVGLPDGQRFLDYFADRQINTDFLVTDLTP